MLENIRLAFQGIWSHKLRSFLTMLGIIIGIAAIIAIVSTIKGSNEQIKNNLIGSGNNTVAVSLSQGGESLVYYDASIIPKGVPPVSQKVKDSILALDEVEAVTTFKTRNISEGIFYKNVSLSDLNIYGVDQDYMRTCNYVIKTGRSFIQSDYDKFRKVMIVDQVAASTLFGDENPLGKTVEISKVPFTIIGIAEERVYFQPVINTVEDYQTYTNESHGLVLIPNASWPILYNYDEPENVIVKAVTTDDMPQAGRKTAAILNEIIDTHLTSARYSFRDKLNTAAGIQQLSSQQNILLITIAGISLLVGGIGVMNIMLVSVRERTSEIGLKKAIGARKGAILWQFLTEAAVLTSIGGMLGVGCGVGAAYIIHYFTRLPVAIDVFASILAVGFSMLIGLTFGFLPSVQAANLDPIEALRRE